MSEIGRALEGVSPAHPVVDAERSRKAAPAIKAERGALAVMSLLVFLVSGIRFRCISGSIHYEKMGSALPSVTAPLPASLFRCVGIPES
jgi:hypothetical protein